MPKPPETVDRYKLFAFVTLEQFGPVIAAMTRLGVENIQHELVTDVHLFKQRPKFEQKAKDVILEYINEHPTFQIGDVVKLFQEQGRTAGAAYAGAKLLVEKKILKQLGGGNYSVATVKHLKGPEKVKVKTKPKAHEITNYDFIWSKVKGRKSFTSEEMRKLFNEDGRNPNSISPQINKMVTGKRIKIVAPGKYEVLKSDAAKLNGSSPSPSFAPTVEETAHG